MDEDEMDMTVYGEDEEDEEDEVDAELRKKEEENISQLITGLDYLGIQKDDLRKAKNKRRINKFLEKKKKEEERKKKQDEEIRGRFGLSTIDEFKFILRL